MSRLSPFSKRGSGTIAAAFQVTDQDWFFPPGVNVTNESGWVYSVQTANGMQQVKPGDWVAVHEDKTVHALNPSAFNAQYDPFS